MKYDIIEQAGAVFGEQLAQIFSSVRSTAVTVASVDENAANVYIFEEDKTFPVPLTFFGSDEYGLSVVPTVGSIALITYVNGDINRPIFIKVAEVDKIVFKRSQTTVSLTVDPNDESLDDLSVSVGESSLRITKDVIEMNGGALNGLVVVSKLTDRLNKLQDEINNIQSSIASHIHTVATTGTAAAQTGTTTGTTYQRVVLTEVQDSDYENDKITQ